MISVSILAFLFANVSLGLALPKGFKAPFDVQGHRGGRGNTIENTLPSFAWGLIDGVTTLELDNGITKDGVVVVWHDQNIPATKCKDTAPVFKNDPSFPYVGKNIANLTLAQIKTLDCGSQRLIDFPIQLNYPGTKISTLKEVFDFVACADTNRKVLWNIESKVDAVTPNNTRSPADFVKLQHAVFTASSYSIKSITYQSFDWRTLVGMKALDPRAITAALVDSETAPSVDVVSPWLAGLKLADFPGTTIDVKIANAAKSIKADVLSPSAVSGKSPVPDPTQAGYIPFTTKEMVDRAHQVGMTVKPWTVDRLNIVDQLLDWGVDGIISDYPTQLRRRVMQRGLPVASQFSEKKVLACLAKHTR
ncbi:Glycerophosphoryl diester phosphodiesterase [Hypsizygus marmoreus]|uniref:Glycerophosphoryl diester phosphodiesterase n=1 Tax=Hypsizygus marmoreus TaxID=39966 RepID=A0A369K2I0_HYPMA|nr:Glycerophosphoryl diester phosphodiesterase [Hypsizygus marmoreus]